MVPEQKEKNPKQVALDYENQVRPVAGQLVQIKSFQTQEHADVGMKQAQGIAEFRKAVEAKRDGFIKPLKQVVKELNGFFKPSVDLCKATEAHLKSLFVDFQQRQRALVEAQLAEAATAEQIKEVAAAARPKTQGVTLVDKWSFEVTDESQIPREFFVLDMKRLEALARAEKDKLNIPGIKPVNKPYAKYT